MGQELMQRRIKEPDRCGISLQLLKHPDEILPLERQDLRKCRFSVLLGVRQNHLAHGVDAVAFKEHVLGAAKSNANRAERERMRRLFRGVSISADLHTSDLGTPIHKLLEVLISLALAGVEGFLDKHLNDFGRSS